MRLARKVTFFVLSLATALIYAATQQDEPSATSVGSLISACADGQMLICDQINQIEHPATASSPIDAMAMEFARKAPDRQLTEEQLPNLIKTYPLIIEDYFTNPNISAENKQQWFKPAALEDCARHYHIEWRIEKNWSPVLKNGDPDWRTLYPHVLDHYFGYCVIQ